MFIMISKPTSIVFLKAGRLIRYKSSLTLAFICFKRFEATHMLILEALDDKIN